MNHYINLSYHTLISDEEDFLNLDFNFQFEPKYSKIIKEPEIECLYQSLLELYKKEEIYINPLFTQLIYCGIKKPRNRSSKSILIKKLKNAAFNLKNNDQIIIRIQLELKLSNGRPICFLLR